MPRQYRHRPVSPHFDNAGPNAPAPGDAEAEGDAEAVEAPDDAEAPENDGGYFATDVRVNQLLDAYTRVQGEFNRVGAHPRNIWAAVSSNF